MATSSETAGKEIAYLAGPMRGLPRFNFDAFHSAAADLRARGWEILSPVEHDEEAGFDPDTMTEDDFDLQSAMRWDIGSVLISDAVILLPGWESSWGVGVEMMVAQAIGIKALLYPNLNVLEWT